METKEILKGILMHFIKEKDNIIGILSTLRTEKQQIEMIEWIEKNYKKTELTTDMIITQALKIAHLEE
ncbi:MAG: hypothetical protein IKZ96_01160 [Bacilli bacterium]|nr:hypothetical protein [Bacilli bacterium]